MDTVKITWLLVLAGAVVTAACGDSKSSMNPVAPSVVVSGLQSEEAGADGVSTTTGKPTNPGNGNGNGNGNDNGNGKQPNVPSAPQPPTNTTPGAPGLKKVEIEGLISAKGGNSIVVNGQIVIVPATCPIRHGSREFTFADLHVGDRVHVTASRTTEGSGPAAVTSLEATEVKLQNPGDGEGAAATELVSVSAFDALAAETGANTGTFRLTRAGSPILLAVPLTVSFTLTGTAGNGSDYTNLPLTATFLAGQATVDVVVTPLADPTTEGDETVILTLTTVTPYELGAPSTATVTISDANTGIVSVTAFDSTASETGANTGTFRLARAGSPILLAAPLTVSFTLTGTAGNGSDYTNLPLTATFLAGQATVDVVVTPLVDPTTEGSETVILTLTTVTPYELGSPSTATVTITDAAVPLVSVTAFDPTASEPTGVVDKGTFRFFRTGSTAASLTVTFTVGGTASAGDYVALPVSVTFGPGISTRDLMVTPIADGVPEGTETVILTLDDGPTYDVVAPGVATVTISG